MCELVCDLSPKGECVPAFTRESKRGPFVREVEKRDEKRLGDKIYGSSFDRFFSSAGVEGSQRTGKCMYIKARRNQWITQPSGAATPRNSDAHKRIAVPKALCILREYIQPRPKSGKVRRSDTRPRRISETCETEQSEGSDSTPIQNAPCFAVCALVCDLSPKAECVPTFTCESERRAFVREVENRDKKRFEAALWR